MVGSKAKKEIPAPDPQNPIINTAPLDSKKTKIDAQKDTLKLESIKTLPNEEGSGLLPESMKTEMDTSGVIP